jgi:hypothetical protein
MRKSSIDNRQSVNRQSPIANRQFDNGLLPETRPRLRAGDESL